MKIKRKGTKRKGTKRKRTISKKILTRQILKGGATAMTSFSNSSEIEFFFNNHTTDDWKMPMKLSSHSYTFAPYNVDLTDSHPIYFGSLPTQPTELYVPIYQYMHMMEVEGDNNGIDEDTLRKYNYIKNILLKPVFTQCLNTAQSCTFTRGLRSRTTSSCCGFIAPVIGVVLHFIDEYTKQGQNIYATQMNEAINMGINFYALHTGYGTSPLSWNRNCNKWANNLKEGTNIMTLYERNRLDVANCTTYHHFIIYKERDFCIIIDSWAGSGGHRGEWVRIMKTEDIISVLRDISTTNDLDETNRLLNAYFIVPHSLDVHDNIDHNLQLELLSVGAYNLVDWHKEMNGLANLSKTNTFFSYGG